MPTILRNMTASDVPSVVVRDLGGVHRVRTESWFGVSDGVMVAGDLPNRPDSGFDGAAVSG